MLGGIWLDYSNAEPLEHMGSHLNGDTAILMDLGYLIRTFIGRHKLAFNFLVDDGDLITWLIIMEETTTVLIEERLIYQLLSSLLNCLNVCNKRNGKQHVSVKYHSTWRLIEGLGVSGAYGKPC